MQRGTGRVAFGNFIILREVFDQVRGERRLGGEITYCPSEIEALPTNSPIRIEVNKTVNCL